MTQLFTNNALSLLSSPLNSSDLVIHVIPGDGVLYPQPVSSSDYFVITLEDPTANRREIIKCIGRTGDQLIVDPSGRGFDGTVVQNWHIDDLVDHRATAHFYNKILAGSVSPVNGSTSISDPVNIVDPSNTKNANVFTTSFPAKLSCKWIITVLDQASGHISVCEVLACYRGPLNPPMFSVYAKTGDKLKYNIEVDVNGADLELNVTNIDNIPLLMTWIRINN